MNDVCLNGHEWTPENTHTNTKGVRFCRTCRREAMRRIRAQATERMDRTRCKNGHPRQIVDGQPVKRCRECHREQNKRYRDRQREKLGKPKRKPATPRKTGLPVGWEETRQPRKPRKPNNRNKISDVNYMPWDEATADRFTAAALATLRRHDATDLSDMLGLNQPERKTA